MCFRLSSVYLYIPTLDLQADLFFPTQIAMLMTPFHKGEFC